MKLKRTERRCRGLYKCECGAEMTHPGTFKVHSNRCWSPRTIERLHFLCGVTVPLALNDCWEATKGVDVLRYARVQAGVGIGRVRATHAVMFIVNGEWPKSDELVMHSCDNPPCVNPFHLSIGSHVDNQIDKVNKGRQHRPTGNLNGRSVLTEKDAIMIRGLVGLGVSRKQLAETFGVGTSTIHDVISGKRWRDV